MMLLTDAMSKLSYTYELILVDDGSKDNTLNKMLELAKSDSRFKSS